METSLETKKRDSSKSSQAARLSRKGGSIGIRAATAHCGKISLTVPPNSVFSYTRISLTVYHTFSDDSSIVTPIVSCECDATTLSKCIKLKLPFLKKAFDDHHQELVVLIKNGQRKGWRQESKTISIKSWDSHKVTLITKQPHLLEGSVLAVGVKVHTTKYSPAGTRSDVDLFLKYRKEWTPDKESLCYLDEKTFKKLCEQLDLGENWLDFSQHTLDLEPSNYQWLWQQAKKTNFSPGNDLLNIYLIKQHRNGQEKMKVLNGLKKDFFDCKLIHDCVLIVDNYIKKV